ncbi:hypothetical protein WDZ92_46135, partial [Nostoc sp. NIES-2111]
MVRHVASGVAERPDAEAAHMTPEKHRRVLQAAFAAGGVASGVIPARATQAEFDSFREAQEAEVARSFRQRGATEEQVREGVNAFREGLWAGIECRALADGGSA